MFKNRHILPIFLLYFLTSTAFLAFFGTLFYEREKRFMLDKNALDMRDFRRELTMKLRINGTLESSDFNNTIAYVVNLKTKEIIRSDFIATPMRLRGGMPYRDKNVVQFSVYDKNKIQTEYFIAIKTDDFEAKIFDLKLKIWLICLGILMAILLIAYFIIRLSVRPLYEKIEFLDSFLRDTTHEINTPLSVILMSVEMFSLNPAKYLKNIKTASTTLSNLYEDLVAIKFNKTDEPLENVDVRAMIDERLEYFGINLETKGITLKLNLKECKIYTSKFKIRKIIDNLLSNAIKYCNESGVVSINLDQKSLSISNTGLEIKKQDLPHIFELYTRFDKTNGGFGVGLSLVKKFADELGFVILANSDSQSTIFTIKF